MGRIRVDADTLRSFVSALDGRISEYESLNSRLEALNNSIQTTWKGDARISFETMMAGYLQQTDKLGDILYQFRNYAQEAADKFESVDLDCASRIRNSF